MKTDNFNMQQIIHLETQPALNTNLGSTHIILRWVMYTSL